MENFIFCAVTVGFFWDKRNPFVVRECFYNSRRILDIKVKLGVFLKNFLENIFKLNSQPSGTFPYVGVTDFETRPGLIRPIIWHSKNYFLVFFSLSGLRHGFVLKVYIV